MKSFRAASEHHQARGIPNTSTFHGSGIHEHEFSQNGVAHCRVAGRELLGEVGSTGLAAATTFPIGARLPAGMFPVAPSYLGGRLELMAQQYEQHSVHKLNISYEPVVPATTDGAVAMFFTNDIGDVTTYVGEAELNHAATHDSFVQTTVWNRAEIKVNPSDAIKRYFDEDHDEPRLSVQGIVEIIAADSLTLDPAGSAGPVSLGNVYVEYDIEFFASATSNDVDVRVRSTLTLTAGAAPVVDPFQPIECLVMSAGVPAVWQLALAFSNYPPGVGPGDLVGWGFYGVVTKPLLAADASGVNWATDEDLVEHFAIGQGLWTKFSWVLPDPGAKGFVPVGSNTPLLKGMLYTDLGGMENAITSEFATNSSTLLFGSGTSRTPAAASTMKIEGYFVKLSEQS